MLDRKTTINNKETDRESISHMISERTEQRTEGRDEPGGLQRNIKKVQRIQLLHNEYELNPSVDNGNAREERSTFFKNE